MAEWGLSPLGNLAQFEIPQFRTGEGLAAILALKQRQAERAQDVGASIGMSLGEAMEQKKKDELANALADQAAGYYGIDVPRGEGLGSGELRLKAMKSIFEAQQAGQEAPLEMDLLRARIARANRPATGGGGGGGGGGGSGEFETRWHNGVEYRKSATGRGWVPIKTEGGGAAGGGRRGGASISESINKGIEKQLGELGTTTEEFGADIQVPGKVTYWTPDFSKQISSQEAATTENAQAVLPGKGVLPVKDYAKLGQKFRMAGQYEQKATMPKTEVSEEENYADEAAARAAGYQTGQTVNLFDPATKRYRPAILD